ncbi:MAG: ABC transporter ATP-binding protein [Planctomycetota bacterium]
MIRAERLELIAGDFHLGGIDLEISRGEYFVILGPTGSGKTLFLESLCGLRRLASGRVWMDGRDVTALEPRRRNIGYVPQDYALFPHLTVGENLRFGAAAQGLPDPAGKASSVAELLGIRPLLNRRIRDLSGGEKQRVALGRALAIEPDVLLLDEPVSALDEVTRDAVCAEIRRLQRLLGMTTIHVSHNLEEAFLVADRGGILRSGKFEQTGTLEDLLRRPRTGFVARFMRCENVFEGDFPPLPAAALMLGGMAIHVPGAGAPGRRSFMIRPEDIILAKSCPPGIPSMPVRIASHVDRGAFVRVEAEGDVRLVVYMTPAAFREIGGGSGSLRALIRPEAVHVIG